MRTVWIAFVVVVWASASYAERRVALVFGANRYDTLRPLENAVNDARAIEDTLETLDFEVFAERDRDLRRMRRALGDFEEDAAGADVALIFFAGHGVEIAGENRLLPTDADASSVEALTASSLSLNEIQAVAARVAPLSLIILDACRNDPFAQLSDPDGRGAFSLDLPASVQPGMGRMGAAENTLFAFSAAPGETAQDGAGENSPFTAALTKYLGTDGLEIRSVLTLVQQEVYDRTAGNQLPYVESGLPSLFFASQVPQDLTERDRLLLAMADIDTATRQDVERIAREVGAPLAPLYGAVVGSNLGKLNREERRAKLSEAAKAFLKVRDELRLLRSDDAAVTALRQQAEAALSLGAFEASRALLTKAAEIDASSRATLKSNLLQRTLSEAATHYLNGGAAQAELKYTLALADHAKAAALFDEVDPGEFPAAAREQQLNALGAIGRINITVGNLPAAAAAFQRQRRAAQDATNASPEDPAFQLALALAQDNFGDVQFEQGMIAEALEHFRAGHAVRLALAALAPDDEDIKFALSNSHQRLGQIYHRQGNLAAAEAQYLKKHALGVAMVALNPAGYRWQRDLSISDEMLGDVLRDRGDLPGAFQRYSASLARMVPLRTAHPADRELSRFTSITLDRLGDVFSAQGELEKAKEKFEQSRVLRLGLVAADPANVDWQYVLGISHERIGDILSRMGDTPAATEAYEAKHGIASLLAQADPTNVRWLRDLSVADERLGNLARGRGAAGEALAHYRRSLDRMKAVRAASPEDKELTRFVSFTQDLIAHVLLDEGDADAAIALYQDSLALREELVALDPDNPDWRFILGVSHELLGNTFMRIGDPSNAVDAYTQELAAMSALLEQDPENGRWKRAVSVTNELLGDALVASGDLSGAIIQYHASLARMTQHRDANPGNLGLQRFTAVTLRKIGQTHLTLGETKASHAAYVQSLAVSETLVRADPNNTLWIGDRLLAHKGILDADGNEDIHVQGVMEMARELEKRDALTPFFEQVVTTVRNRGSVPAD